MTLSPVLYVEDDTNDVLLMRRAWAKVGVANPLEVVSDGEEALRFLSGEGQYANRADHPLPCLVLLDLKLPKLLGLDVLKWIRERTALLGLRVIVISSSRQSQDMNAAHALGIDAYLVKPGPFDEWSAMVEKVNVYWLKGR